MTKLDALKLRLTEAAVLADGLFQEAHDDDACVALLEAQLAGSLHLVTRLIGRRTARGGKSALSLGSRQERQIEGRPVVELMDPGVSAEDV